MSMTKKEKEIFADDLESAANEVRASIELDSILEKCHTGIKRFRGQEEEEEELLGNIDSIKSETPDIVTVEPEPVKVEPVKKKAGRPSNLELAQRAVSEYAAKITEEFDIDEAFQYVESKYTHLSHDLVQEAVHGWVSGKDFYH